MISAGRQATRAISPRTVLAMACFAGVAGCRGVPAERPPSILLFVFDTARVDAVSAYGRVSATTPETDALAATGLRYTRAYTHAPWTLPSHATLFTGLLPSQHGVSWRRLRAPDALVTLAERLHAAGYATVGVSENKSVSQTSNLAQGFERFYPRSRDSGVEAPVAAWLGERRDERPVFLFVNVLDAHAPHAAREANPFLPPGVSAADAGLVPQADEHYLCSTSPQERELAILRGLYLDSVAAADAKLHRVRALLRDAGLGRDLVTIVTSDHGEHLGEHRLVSHQFSLREAVLHVPLVVHGLRSAPAVIDEPVGLVDVVPTVLRLAGLAVPQGLAGRPLPTAPGPPGPPRAIIAEYVSLDGPGWIRGAGPTRHNRITARRMRRYCRPEDKVFGDMRAVVRYPF